MAVMDPQEPLGFCVDHGAVHVAQLDRHRIGPEPRRLLGRRTDVRHFRERVGRPRNNQRADALAPVKQRVLDDDAGHRVGGVRELI